MCLNNKESAVVQLLNMSFLSEYLTCDVSKRKKNAISLWSPSTSSDELEKLFSYIEKETNDFKIQKLNFTVILSDFSFRSL